MSARGPVRGSYARQTGLLERVLALLEVVFGAGFGRAERRGRALGLRWEKVSTPFLAFEDERLVAHVGVLEVPLVLKGERRLVGGIHAVATHPEHRGRGHCRRALEGALAWCEERYETLCLSTGKPALYERFAFRVVPEHRAVLPWTGGPGRDGFRRLDLDAQGDVLLLRRLLRERAPVSRRLGLVEDEAVFLFNEGQSPLRYAEDLQAIACWQREGTTLRLWDLVAPRIPTLAQVLARVPGPVERVGAYFGPDRLGTEAATEPHVLDGDDRLMVRGPFAPEGRPFMLPRPARW